VTHPFFEGGKHPRVFAHRGFASPDSPDIWENTAAAFAAAHALGVEYIESDCQVTADGDVVLFHDDTLKRLSGDPRKVSVVTTRELTELFSVHGGILTLAEALHLYPSLRFNIDVKTDAALPHIGPAIAPHTHRVLLTSFSDKRRKLAIEAVRRAGASMPPAVSPGQNTIAAICMASASGMTAALSRMLGRIDALQIPVKHKGVRVLTKSLIRQAHEHEVEVHVWTINDPAQMRTLIELGVDGIVTDRSDLAVEALF
jgi:glycerophosphoryl diester phosphodiesterase